MTSVSLNRKDIDLDYRLRKIKGNFSEPCSKCKKLTGTHRRIIMQGGDFKIVAKQYWRDLCIDCASIECKLWDYAKNNMPHRQDLVKDHKVKCKYSIDRAEEIKKNVNQHEIDLSEKIRNMSPPNSSPRQNTTELNADVIGKIIANLDAEDIMNFYHSDPVFRSRIEDSGCGNTERFINIKKLDIELLNNLNNFITDICPKWKIDLDLSGNQTIEDVSALGEIDHLYSLNLENTLVTDVSMLGNVHILNLVATDVTDVSMLGKVDDLNLSETDVTDVSELGKVHMLYLSNTQVTDVSALGKGKGQTLYLAATPVTDVSKLGGVYNLNLAGTTVSDVSMLGRAHKLDLSYTRVSDVSALGGVDILLLDGSEVTDWRIIRDPQGYAIKPRF